MNQDLRIAWAASFLLHLLLLLFALVSTLPDIIRRSEFLELQWGTIASTPSEEVRQVPSTQQPPVSQPPRSTPTPVVTKSKGPAPAATTRDITLPERRLRDMSDDVLAVPPQGEKLETSTGGGIPGLPERSTPEDTRDPLSLREGGTTPGDKALPSASGAGEGTRGPGSGTVGSDVGFSVQWVGGGSRKRVSGRLPEYPEGVNVRAEVLIRAVVAPDGSVLSVTPLRKANRSLEEAAMAELRLWKFEALRSNVEQVNQDCLVTFVFTLR